MADDPKPDAPAEPVVDENAGLVEVWKDLVRMFVHPTALAEHLALGWARV